MFFDWVGSKSTKSGDLMEVVSMSHRVQYCSGLI